MKPAQAIYVSSHIRADLDAIWEYTQNPKLHQQWDLRFTDIQPISSPGEREQHFRYRTRIGFGLAITGSGVSRAIGAERQDKRLSTLLFRSGQAISLISEGSGYWKYSCRGSGVDFETRYNYQVRFGAVGRLFDRIVFRPLFGYATAWSFDLLRICLEKRVAPALASRMAVVHYLALAVLCSLWLYQGLVPKMLFPQSGELALAQATGVLPGLEQGLVRVLGLVEIGLGIGAVWFRRCKWSYYLQLFTLLIVTAVSLTAFPELLQAPFNPLTLALAMACLVAVAGLASSWVPDARRCKRIPSAEPHKGGDS